jgi:hypothetical protein
VDPNADRSESTLAVNPLDSNNLVGSSKRFTNPRTYEFTLAAYASFDNGLTWTEAPPLQLLHNGDQGYTGPDWAGVSDPEVVFDDQGTAYLIALPFVAGANPVGIAIYQSYDGGLTWSPPNLIHFTFGDDKPGAAADNSPQSPFFGNVYTAWDDGVRMRFGRTTDRGATWRGAGNDPVGTILAVDSFAPALAVGDDGTVFITWVAGSQVKFVKSTDGGDSFSAPAVLASGITNLSSAGLPAPDGFPELPGGRFRVVTLTAVATGPGGEVVTAWADYREHVSRIYYRRSTDGGLTWEGPASGQPLLTGDGTPGSDQHDFHPQLVRAPQGGEIGCSFYEFGPKPGQDPNVPLIDVVFASSIDAGASFPNPSIVTDQAWDPAVDAPLSHGSPRTTFIGEYFGLAADADGFFPFWTDTRTGIQEMFTDFVPGTPVGP